MITEKDREFMKLAIEEAARSERGSETDPKVGAVAVRDGNVIDLAHRGQMAPGDHAEFTLLHKVLRSKDRTRGATLYTTLEPCTTRSHDKMPCADWIVQKEIRRVVIGMLDPNPSICGRSFWRLYEAGIEIDFFPGEMTREIIELNRPFVDRQRGGKCLGSVLEQEIQQRKSPLISCYPNLGYNDALVLGQTPNLREGWPLTRVMVKFGETEPFALPKRYEYAYAQYFERCYDEKGFEDDGEKFMLIRNPTTFTDAPSLSLEVRPTKYSHVQFYRDNIAANSSEKTDLIEDLVRGSLQAKFPHSLCMHMMVLTSDNRLLLTQRSPKVAYSPQTWSASVEEQLSRDDFAGGPEGIAFNWAARLLTEELGIAHDSYHPDDLRLLSVFLEADILNIAICVYADLRIEESELTARIRAGVRPDYEFDRFEFMDADRETLTREVFRPTRHYHPTSGLRLLYALLKRHGGPTEGEISRLMST